MHSSAYADVQGSKDAKIFCLIHKMDLVNEAVRDVVRASCNDNQQLLLLLLLCAAFSWHNRPLHSRISCRQTFNQREAELKRRSLPLEITCFKTSIWDETLYKVCMLIGRPAFLLLFGNLEGEQT